MKMSMRLNKSRNVRGPVPVLVCFAGPVTKGSKGENNIRVSAGGVGPSGGGRGHIGRHLLKYGCCLSLWEWRRQENGRGHMCYSCLKCCRLTVFFAAWGRADDSEPAAD